MQPVLLAEYERFLDHPYQEHMIDWDGPIIQEMDRLADFRAPAEPLHPTRGTLTAITQEVMARKLDFPTEFEDSRQLGTVSLKLVSNFFSYVGDTDKGEQLFEPLLFYGVAVLLDEQGIRQLPKENDKYKHIGFTRDTRTFYQDIQQKNVFNLVPSAGDAAVGYCAMGGCLKTSHVVNQRMLHDRPA